MSDAAIDSAKNEVNNTVLHMQREKEITSKDHNASNNELWINKYDDEFIEEVEHITIKSELPDITEQEEEADVHFPKPIMIIKENLSDDEKTTDSVSNVSDVSEEEYHTVDKEREVNEAMQAKRKLIKCSAAALSNRNEGFSKKRRQTSEDVMLRSKVQNTQESFRGLVSKFEDNVTHTPIKKENLLEDGNNSVEILKTVNINIEFIKLDEENSKNLFICDICEKSYQKKAYLIRHIQGHLNLFKCTYCNYKTFVKRCLKEHVNSKHTKITLNECSYCDYKTNYKSSLNRHVNIKHTKDTVYNCSHCTYKTYDNTYLTAHVNSKHTKKTVYNCTYCSYKTYFKSNLSSHVNSKHTKITVYDCSYCDFKTYNKSDLDRHVNGRHTKDTVYNCSYCSYHTFDKSNLGKHENNKHTKNTVYNCSYCTYVAYDKTCLSAHVKRKHAKNTVYNCSYCDYSTCDKSNLSRHENNKHTKDTVYHCSRCSFQTYFKSNLSRHENRQHKKNTVYHCTFCTFETDGKKSLTCHMNTKHTKNAVKVCDKVNLNHPSDGEHS